jgi:hypothetical protein
VNRVEEQPVGSRRAHLLHRGAETGDVVSPPTPITPGS